MLALVVAMLFCVLIGAGVAGFVLLEARREGRGAFWTAEGEELIAGARRTTDKARARGGDLVGTAVRRARTRAGRPAGRPEDAAVQDRRHVEPDGYRVVRDKVYEEPAEDEDGAVRRVG